jgi:hypothetical protein
VLLGYMSLSKKLFRRRQYASFGRSIWLVSAEIRRLDGSPPAMYLVVASTGRLSLLYN